MTVQEIVKGLTDCESLQDWEKRWVDKVRWLIQEGQEISESREDILRLIWEGQKCGQLRRDG